MPNVKRNFQWSPNKNFLAFQSDNALKMLNAQTSNLPQNVTTGVENFSWLPDGSGFLTSTKATKSIYSDILLSKIIVGKSSISKLAKPRPFYTISVSKGDYPFVSTSQFKWSKDKKWIAFQLIPTASLSADGNILCILSNDGITFKKSDEMLNYEEWFQWAPTDIALGYIRGFGRTATKDKKLLIKNMSKDTTLLFTPKGYVD